jgi:prepilin-type N-terminal cleavage/methylation domain-containing protein
MQKGFIMKIKADLKALRQQAGYTLIELSISVAIIAVLVVTGLYGVPRILDTNRTTTVTQQILLASANYSKIASQMFGQAKTFADSTTATGLASLGQMGVWSDDALIKSATTGAVTRIIHPFGGAISSRSNALTYSSLAADEGVWIRLDAVPVKNCFAVTSAFMNSAVSAWVATDTTYSEPTAANVSGTTSPKVPGGAVSLTNLATLCQGASGTTKSIYLLFAY